MQQRLHWLDYDPVALAVLTIGMGMVALLAIEHLSLQNRATRVAGIHDVSC